MNELTLLTENTGLRSLDKQALARIETGMLEQKRIAAVFGRQNTQTTSKLMSLTMVAAAPYRQLRQCAAEIEKRRGALQENLIRMQRARIEATQAREEAETLTGHARELRLLDAFEREQGIESGRPYIEGALKDIAALQDAYEQIRTAHGIRENWDEADFEAAEVEHHIKSIFRLALRDVLSTGRISHAACEYAEQFGIHPATVIRRTMEYVTGLEEAMTANSTPSIDSLHHWLEACYQQHKDDIHAATRHLGLTDLITKFSLYVEPDPITT